MVEGVTCLKKCSKVENDMEKGLTCLKSRKWSGGRGDLSKWIRDEGNNDC